MKCVSKQECGCYDNEGKHYKEGQSVPPKENCYIWYDTFHVIHKAVGAKVYNNLVFNKNLI